jgi:hypothetical protein
LNGPAFDSSSAISFVTSVMLFLRAGIIHTDCPLHNGKWGDTVRPTG